MNYFEIAPGDEADPPGVSIPSEPMRETDLRKKLEHYRHQLIIAQRECEAIRDLLLVLHVDNVQVRRHALMRARTVQRIIEAIMDELQRDRTE